MSALLQLPEATAITVPLQFHDKQTVGRGGDGSRGAAAAPRDLDGSVCRTWNQSVTFFLIETALQYMLHSHGVASGHPFSAPAPGFKCQTAAAAAAQLN
jgi:hypothetical protein